MKKHKLKSIDVLAHYGVENNKLEKTATYVSAAVVMAAIEKKATPLFKRLADAAISSSKDFDKLAADLSELKELSKLADAEQKTITNPLNEALKATRAHFKPFIDRVAEVEGLKKIEMRHFLLNQAKASKALEAKLESGEIKKVSTLVRKQAELAITTSHAQVRRVWTLTIVDAKKIPREFLVPDEQCIREAFKAGRDVAGCKWEQIETVAI